MAMRIKVHKADIREMARVGYVDRLEIYVWPGDSGKIPHVYVSNKEPRGKSSSMDTCIQLEKSEYFTHGSHKGVLNASQRKAFDTFMHDAPKQGVFGSNYELAVYLWNMNNSDNNVVLERDTEGKVVIPDYKDIAPYKEGN